MINNAARLPSLLLGELTGSESERRLGHCALLLKTESFVHTLPARMSLSICVPLNVTAAPPTTPSLRAADNEHINMYIPSQVNARLALQFHGPV